jgi:hypothetical protein
MAKHLDIEKVRTALKSAARNAVSGPRELRSGRFVACDAGTGQLPDKDAVKGSPSNQNEQKQ